MNYCMQVILLLIYFNYNMCLLSETYIKYAAEAIGPSTDRVLGRETVPSCMHVHQSKLYLYNYTCMHFHKGIYDVQSESNIENFMYYIFMHRDGRLTQRVFWHPHHPREGSHHVSQFIHNSFWKMLEVKKNQYFQRESFRIDFQLYCIRNERNAFISSTTASVTREMLSFPALLHKLRD